MSDQSAPDHTQDPREADTSQAGYPETNPEPASPEGGQDRSGGDVDSDAPSTSTDKEADRGHSTGNPDAAG